MKCRDQFVRSISKNFLMTIKMSVLQVSHPFLFRLPIVTTSFSFCILHIGYYIYTFFHRIKKFYIVHTYRYVYSLFRPQNGLSRVYVFCAIKCNLLENVCDTCPLFSHHETRESTSCFLFF